ncbi:MAG: hypothetical protein CFE31_02040 [Rhizobiales bacterium PAR1]|nr:MAG: hypothetical protein CFE31_02040 [Rhizobiales bacterium PAR1]
MKISTFVKSAAIGAGLCIFAIGVALAQTAPAPAPTQQAAPASPAAAPLDGRAARDACRDQVDSKLRGTERRDAMQKCMQEKRGATGGPGGGKMDRHAQREHVKEVRNACRDELKTQRFTEEERKTAMQQCAAKKDPKLGKMLACRQEAETKKLERGTREFKTFMRECNTRA